MRARGGMARPTPDKLEKTFELIAALKAAATFEVELMPELIARLPANSIMAIVITANTAYLERPSLDIHTGGWHADNMRIHHRIGDDSFADGECPADFDQQQLIRDSLHDFPASSGK